MIYPLKGRLWRAVVEGMNSFYLGIIAGTLCTVSFVPQVIQIAKTKDTKSLSLGMFLTFTLGVAVWLFYGIAIHEWPVIIANAITLCLALSILVMKIRYG
jgi:MtN3 and saliva related transmembrane protein